MKIKTATKSTRQFSPEEQKAAQRAYDEYQDLTMGKKDMSIKELHDLKTYAKKRTDLEKDENLLTSEQLVWRTLYNSLDELITKNVESGEKENIDNLEEEMDFLDKFKNFLEEIVPLGQEIETELVMQHAALTVYFDKGSENEYRVVVDGITTDLVDPEKWSPEERMEKAETVLKVINTNRDYLYSQQLVGRHEQIYKKLNKFENFFNNMLTTIEKNKKHIKDLSTLKLIDSTREWLDLTKDLYASRTRAISAVKNSIDSDEFLPKYVLKNNGDVSGKVDTTGSFVEQMTAVVVLINKADKEEKDIATKRDPIAEELFGKKEDYVKLDEDNTDEVASIENVSSNSKGRWFMVIGLAIIALIWGIWTAIGVFILGFIMMGVMNSKQS